MVFPSLHTLPQLSIVQHLCETCCATAGEGIELQLKRKRFYTVLTGIYTNTPARAKVMKTLGTGAFLNCDYCIFQASWWVVSSFLALQIV